MWSRPDYQHGFFVPVFSLVLLWLRREMILPLPERGSWWGLAFFPAWAALRWLSAYFRVLVWDPLSLIPFFLGVAVFVGGWRALRWAWPSILFLVFMLPLPGFLDSAFRYPLQRLATIISVFVVQTIGIPAVAEGNVINLSEGQLEVARACSGLRMMMFFSAACVGAAFVLRVALWEKIVIIASAVPIALVSNVARITATAIVRELVTLTPTGIDAVHEYAGYLMMPFAMLVVWGEVILLRKLFAGPAAERPLPLEGMPLMDPRGVPARAVANPRRPS
jgi:exosortase